MVKSGKRNVNRWPRPRIVSCFTFTFEFCGWNEIGKRKGEIEYSVIHSLLR